MRNRLGIVFNLKYFFLPRNNHWLKRIILVFAFVLFDYSSTLVFCHSPNEEANVYARIFMENFGVPLGLTMFVFGANLPIYLILSLDSHVIRLPFKTAKIVESFVDVVFAWFIAGLHFSGGASWFWHASSLTRQVFGAFLYLAIAFVFAKSHKPCHDN